MDREERLVLRLINAVERCADCLEDLATIAGTMTAVPNESTGESDHGEDESLLFEEQVDGEKA